jgi:hypothetical protein
MHFRSASEEVVNNRRLPEMCRKRERIPSKGIEETCGDSWTERCGTCTTEETTVAWLAPEVGDGYRLCIYLSQWHIFLSISNGSDIGFNEKTATTS